MRHQINNHKISKIPQVTHKTYNETLPMTLKINRKSKRKLTNLTNTLYPIKAVPVEEEEIPIDEEITKTSIFMNHLNNHKDKEICMFHINRIKTIKGCLVKLSR